MDTTTPATNLLTFAQVSRLGLDVNLLHRWVRTEQAPAVIVGRCKWIPPAWIDAQPEAKMSDPSGKAVSYDQPPR